MSPTFPQRKIGDDFVSSIGFGCMSLAVPPAPSEEEALQLLTAAADKGINFWVTSNHYGPAEKIIGRWFKETGRRNEIFLATKIGPKMVDGKMETDGTPEHVKKACYASLERLQTDHIDLYAPSRVDPTIPIEKTVQALVELKNEGKIRYLGLSECSARSLKRAHAVHPIAAAEMEFSPFALDIETPETNFLATARELGVKIMCYSPLGRGFLTGTIQSRDDMDDADMRKKFHPKFSEENFAGNLKIVQAIEKIARRKGVKPGQLALAWVMAQGDDFIPIPGTKRVKYLEENAAAVDVELTSEDDESIRQAIGSLGGRKGERYPAMFLSQLFADSPELE
ncbi:aldo-keto reductase [Lophiostoma macrostomum CBS 122681]|uniref:Aldo-keto reductase n=1 Tax=Lophiostoma macrostomum CBS 122681 TaxID=1314788 RepID=A0A6A6SM73_9PLEO|nr:aldo-keto reductase [Lophiostoma macrostomum CBS 122681]